MPKPNGTHDRDQRRARILDLVQRQPIRNQQELQALLGRGGHVVNQGTLSRDLRDMGLVKGPAGYELPQPTVPAGDDAASGFRQGVRQWLATVAVAQNLLVLKTPAGGASPLAVALDRAEPDGMLGTVAGDDTVLVICKSAPKARSLARALERAREVRR